MPSILSDLVVPPASPILLDAILLDATVLDAIILDTILLDAIILDTILLDAVILDAVLLDVILIDAILMDCPRFSLVQLSSIALDYCMYPPSRCRSHSSQSPSIAMLDSTSTIVLD